MRLDRLIEWTAEVERPFLPLSSGRVGSAVTIRNPGQQTFKSPQRS